MSWQGWVAAKSRVALRYRAAEAMAAWVTGFRHPDGRVGLTPDELLELIRRPDPVLLPVIEGLRRGGAWEPEVVRAIKGLLKSMDDTDYLHILRQNPLHEKCHEHALRLVPVEGVEGGGPNWEAFCRQMDMAKDILLKV